MNIHIPNVRKFKWIIFASIAVIVFYLVFEHRAHLIAYSSYLLFIAFVIMHLFMHGSHGGHGGDGRNRHDNSDKK